MIPATTHMGPVALTVADLERSLSYYREAVGLTELLRGDGSATLGAGSRPLLELTEVPGARPADGFTGLFHFALLVPERPDLGAWLAHAAAGGVRLTGASDHFVSEALYLRDPDHHGIEIYWDRPREVWERRVDRMGTWPLDLRSLAAEAPQAPFDGLPDGTVMGHVHLRVADVPAAERFYQEIVGLDLMTHLGDQATFLAAGGYHHHVGANAWESRGRPPAPDGSATLSHFTLVLPDEDARAAVMDRAGSGAPEVVDPSGNRCVLSVG